MLTENLIRLADQLGWQKHAKEDMVFGLYNDYPFTIVDGRSFKAFITPIAGISTEGLVALNDYLTDQSRSLKLRNFEFNDNFLCVRVKEPLFSLPIERMEQILGLLAGILAEYDLPKTACVVCGEPASKRGLYYGLYAHLHPACADRDPVDFTTLPTAGESDREPAADEPAESAWVEVSGEQTTPSSEKGMLPESDQGAADAEAGFRDAGMIDTRPMTDYLPAMTEALVRLCSIPSVKGEPEPDAPYGIETLNALKAFLEIGEQLGFKAVNLDGRAGYVEAGKGDRLIAALCHLDVVPAGTGWQTNPFIPEVQPDRIVARGTTDDKGPAVAVLYALKALLDEGIELKSRIRIIVGLDEESGSTCMEHYVAVAELPDAGFTPDAEFPVIYAEKGIAWYRLSAEREVLSDSGSGLALLTAEGGERPNMVPGSCTVNFRTADGPMTAQYIGKPAHGSRPSQGDNAVASAMADAETRLHAAGITDRFVTAFNALIGRGTDGAGFGIDGSDESGALTLNAGVLSINHEMASLDLDIRYPVTWDLKDLDQRLVAAATAHGLKVELLREQKPLYAPRETPLVQSLMHIYKTITGDPAEPLAIGGGTYARSMPNIVAFGPSFPDDPDTCHQAGESVSLATLERASRIYREAFRSLAR